MRNKLINISLIVICLFSMMTLTSAALTVTVNTPTAGSNNSGTITLNCTTNLISGAASSYNVSFLRSASTGGAATTQIAAVTNTSETQTEFTYSLDTTALTDSASYNFTCKGDNGTTQKTAPSVVATLDNTDPTASITFTKGGITEFMTSIGVSYSCSDAIDASVTTTSVVLNKGQSTSDQVSITASPTVLSGTDLSIIGLNDVVITCTDAAANSYALTKSFTIDTDEAPETQQQQQRQGTYFNSILLWVLIIGAGVIIFLAIVYFATKK